MNIELERTEIIEEIKHIDDERVLRAIRGILYADHEEEIPDEHKRLLDEVIDEFESGKAETVTMEEVKKRLFEKK